VRRYYSVTASEVDCIIRMYERKDFVQDIAAKVMISTRTVYRVLKDHGIRWRGRGGDQRSRKRRKPLCVSSSPSVTG
jgi:hypothetical protein